MPRVLFTITYCVKPEYREQYLQLAAEMKNHFRTVGKKNYSVYEAKGKRNQFTELFVTESLEEFDALEDDQDESTQALVGRLEEFLDSEGMKYTTLMEVE